MSHVTSRAPRQPPAIMDSILENIGNTPLVRLNSIPKSLGVRGYAGRSRPSVVDRQDASRLVRHEGTRPVLVGLGQQAVDDGRRRPPEAHR